MAARQSSRRQQQAAPRPVLADGRQRVARACRIKAAVLAQQRADADLVPAQTGRQDCGQQLGDLRSRRGRRRPCPHDAAFRLARASSKAANRRSASAWATVGAASRTTMSTGGKQRRCRNDSLMIRFARFLSTARLRMRLATIRPSLAAAASLGRTAATSEPRRSRSDGARSTASNSRFVRSRRPRPKRRAGANATGAPGTA